MKKLTFTLGGACLLAAAAGSVNAQVTLRFVSPPAVVPASNPAADGEPTAQARVGWDVLNRSFRPLEIEERLLDVAGSTTQRSKLLDARFPVTTTPRVLANNVNMLPSNRSAISSMVLHRHADGSLVAHCTHDHGADGGVNSKDTVQGGRHDQ